MYDVIERPITVPHPQTPKGRSLEEMADEDRGQKDRGQKDQGQEDQGEEDQAARAALWIIEALAQELSGEPGSSREALVAALRRRAGYQQADGLQPGHHQELQAELVARLAGRLARA